MQNTKLFTIVEKLFEIIEATILVFFYWLFFGLVKIVFEIFRIIIIVSKQFAL